MNDHEMISRLIQLGDGLTARGSKDSGAFLRECADRITEAHLLERVVRAQLGENQPGGGDELLRAVRQLRRDSEPSSELLVAARATLARLRDQIDACLQEPTP